MPAEGAKGKRYLLLRADTPTLEFYVEHHPEAAVTALSSLPLALFQADNLVSDSPPRGSGSLSSSTSSMRSSAGSDVEAMLTPRGAIEAGLGAAAGLQETDCWSGQWRLELVDEIPLGALGTWGQVTQGKQGAGKDTLAIVNGAGRVFEMQLPSVEAAAHWKTQLLAASQIPAASPRAGLSAYLARGRRGGISGLSKSGWLWVEKGKAGGGKWAKRWLELDPDGELRMYNKTAAQDSENFAGATPSGSPPGSPQAGANSPSSSTGSAASVVRMNCEVVTIRSPKNARKDHPHAFRLEASAGTKNTATTPTKAGAVAVKEPTEEFKFILEPVVGAAEPGSGSGSVDLDETDGEGGMVMTSEEDQLRMSAYNAAFGVTVVKSAEEEAQEWIEAIQAAGAAAAQRTAQREMALDDDVDSVLLMQIERLSEEAVLLPVLEPLLAAAAATTAPTFGSGAVPRDPYGDEPIAAGDVSWQMSTDLAHQNP